MKPVDREEFSTKLEMTVRATFDGDPPLVGDDLNVQGPTGETLLIFFVIEGPVECVEYLLALGANADLRDNHGMTALHNCALMGNLKAANVLLAAGASVDLQDSVHGQTPLHLAAISSHLDLVAMLRGFGANTETLDSYDASPLMDCASMGQVDSIGQLLRLGADPFIQNSKGWTALHVAAIHGVRESYEMLAAVSGLAGVRDARDLRASEYLYPEIHPGAPW